MHILVHDFAGHPFQAELSRELARRGHIVNHAYFAHDSGPKGNLERQADDAQSLSFTALGGELDYSKANLFKRRAGDVAYGRILAAHIRKLKPEVVICGNAPTEVVSPLPTAARSVGAPFVYWVQDFNGLAAKRLLASRYLGLGSLVGSYYMWLDEKHLRASDHVVVITEAFLRDTDAMGIPRERTAVIPNWGPIDQIRVLPRDTEWARDHALAPGHRFLYSGTLALKHNPELLVSLARQATPEDQVIVVSSGVGAQMLRTMADRPASLLPMDLQPFNVFEQVLASADVLLAVIEREAGTFSVPSKILSYLCSGRPIVLAAPSENLAARIISESGAGIVVEPENRSGFIDAANHFARDADAARAAGAAGRRYAESNFVISVVAQRFEKVFENARQG